MSEPHRSASQYTFSASELSEIIKLARQTCTASGSGRARLDGIMQQLARIVRAETGCVFESRGASPGLMTELFRYEWRDWQTESLAESMNGRRLDVITHAAIHLVWQAPVEKPSNEGQ